MTKINSGHLIIAFANLAAFTIHALIGQKESPHASGVLNGAIIFKDGSKTSQIGAGSTVEFYDGYIKVSLFPEGTPNEAADVYPLDLIVRIPLKE